MAQNDKLLQVGMRVHIRSMEDAAAPSYGTRVEDVASSYVVVQQPSDKHTPVNFPPGTSVELSMILTEPPGKEGRYRGESVVTRELPGRIPLLRLSLPETWERTQLREFFRVSVLLPVKVRVSSNGDDDKSRDDNWVKGLMQNISAGGCQIMLPKELSSDEQVQVEFDLPNRTFRVPAVVRRSDPDASGHQYVVGLAFTALSERQRDEIIRFAFQRQIELHKKGMA